MTAEKVKNAWQGFGDGYRLLLQTFDEYLEEFARKRVGKDRAASTLENYTRARNYLAAFLRYAYKLEDIPFMELKREFIETHVVLCIWDFNAFGEIRTIFSDVLFRSCRE